MYKTISLKNILLIVTDSKIANGNFLTLSYRSIIITGSRTGNISGSNDPYPQILFAENFQRQRDVKILESCKLPPSCCSHCTISAMVNSAI